MNYIDLFLITHKKKILFFCKQNSGQACEKCLSNIFGKGCGIVINYWREKYGLLLGPKHFEEGLKELISAAENELKRKNE